MNALWIVSGTNSAYLAPPNTLCWNEAGEWVYEVFSTLSPLDDPGAVSSDVISAMILVVDGAPMTDALLATLTQCLTAIGPNVPTMAMVNKSLTTEASNQLSDITWSRIVHLGCEQRHLPQLITTVIEQHHARTQMEQEVKNFSTLAFTAMSSASEMGAVALFAEKVQRVMDQSRLAALIQSCLHDLHLQGVIQFLFAEDVSIYPVDASHASIVLLNSAREASARIISHQRFLLFSFEHIQLLITNAPYDDEERYGRLRDVLAHIASIAEARAKSLKVNTLLQTQQDNAKTVLALIEMAAEANRDAVKAIMTELSDSLRVMASCLDLNMEQEAELLDLSERALTSLEGLQESNEAIEQQFHLLIQQLDKASQLLSPAQDDTSATSTETSDSNVELF